MLSATTLFRATEPGSAERHTGGGDPNGVGVARAAARTVLRDWIGQCEGFQMIGPDGRIGVVTKVETIRGCDLSVATGLFVIRQVAVRRDDVAAIDPRRKRVFVRTACVPEHGWRRRLRRPPTAVGAE